MTPNEKELIEGFRKGLKVKQHRYPEESLISISKVADKHKGAYGELIAMVWLLENGFEVFRNVSDRGDIDMLARTGEGEFLAIDVKTVRVYKNKKEGVTVQVPELTKSQQKKGIQPLYVTADGVCEFDPRRIKRAYERMF